MTSNLVSQLDQYRAATGVLRFMTGVGWVGVAAGGLYFVVAMVVGDDALTTRVLNCVIAIAAILNSLVVIACGQVGQAIIENTLTTKDMLLVLRGHVSESQGQEQATSTPEEPGERTIQFNCPFCDTGMYGFGRCPNCGSTVDQPVLDSHTK